MSPTLGLDCSLRIEAENAHDLSTQLKDAVASLLPDAMAQMNRGILITRYSAREYLVALDPSVPFGTTHERCAWERTNRP